MSGRERKCYKGCVGTFWDGVRNGAFREKIIIMESEAK